MNGLSIAILSSIGTCLFSWYLAHDTVTCNVTGAGTASVNGYYSAVGGMYFKRGESISYFPDIFQILALRQDIGTGSTIAMTKHFWVISSDVRKDVIYKNVPEHPEEFISQPPLDGWVLDSGKIPAPKISNCRGSLQDSPSLPSASPSNIGQMIERPVTSLLLGIIFYVAYYLWSQRTEVSLVSFSYDSVVNQKEYYRMVTASFSHFDAWHLLFNTMSLFQLGELEVTYGSVTFAYLNADLVFITMGICILCSHLMIFKFNRTDQAYQQAVGFSCVLFAWMVAASVRMKQYCPIFLLPTLCFSTYYIPNPLLYFDIGPSLGFPVNIGPVILLVITKVIIPRSSFLGHLSGIIIGYPVAWNLLNWLTPPLALSITAISIILKDNLIPNRFIGYDQNTDLNDLASTEIIKKYKYLRQTMWTLITLSAISIYTFSFTQILPRVVMIYVVWGAVQSRRCEWLSTLRTTHEDCLSLIYIAALGTFFGTFFDIATFGAALSSSDLLLGCGLSQQFVYSGLLLLILLIIFESVYFCLLINCLYDIKLSEPILIKFRLNESAVKIDMKMLGLNNLGGIFFCCSGSGSGNTQDGNGTVPFLSTGHVFDGPGRRLTTSTLISTSTSITNANMSPTQEIEPDEETKLLSKNGKSSITENGNKIRKITDLPVSAPFPLMPHNNNSSGQGGTFV